MQETPVDITEFAALFSVHPRTVSRWIAAGMPTLRPSPGVLRFDVAECKNWMRVNATEAAV